MLSTALEGREGRVILRPLWVWQGYPRMVSWGPGTRSPSSQFREQGLGGLLNDPTLSTALQTKVLGRGKRSLVLVEEAAAGEGSE